MGRWWLWLKVMGEIFGFGVNWWCFYLVWLISFMMWLMMLVLKLVLMSFECFLVLMM